ncbi:uncharacterized protein LOC125806871 isoform X3 [Solanum verrucosum]|uniref:uncharacterized protein LOC125806871 isoform X3 n=1 Tax=Solanum verrucosum TaxID=315347 RepID=UPI0020D19BF3|nr:uncharacterized protein LOC125806871 isoform X3 [Solanum verrucosum]
MSEGEAKKISRQDIQLVQNLIERCLQLYMNQEEVIRTLLDQAKIEPGFTELVWQKLEEENQEFFRAYHVRLMVKDQIERFNDLLERQVEAMQMIPTQPIPNGSQIRQIPPNSTCQARDHTGPHVKPENVHQTVNANLSQVYTNGVSSLQPCMQSAIDVSAHARRIDASSNMLLAQSSNLGMLQGVRGGMIKSEAGYSGNLPFIVESDSQPVNETVLDADTSSFGFLGQIPRNFSLSDLTADFSNSSDILESYSGSAFLATDVNNLFLDPQDRREHQDVKRLDAISEGLRFEDFASD